MKSNQQKKTRRVNPLVVPLMLSKKPGIHTKTWKSKRKLSKQNILGEV